MSFSPRQRSVESRLAVCNAIYSIVFNFGFCRCLIHSFLHCLPPLTLLLSYALAPIHSLAEDVPASDPFTPASSPPFLASSPALHLDSWRAHPSTLSPLPPPLPRTHSLSRRLRLPVSLSLPFRPSV
eukprot:2098451-Pleurochrysis_carterae.AAC.1